MCWKLDCWDTPAQHWQSKTPSWHDFKYLHHKNLGVFFPTWRPNSTGFSIAFSLHEVCNFSLCGVSGRQPGVYVLLPALWIFTDFVKSSTVTVNRLVHRKLIRNYFSSWLFIWVIRLANSQKFTVSYYKLNAFCFWTFDCTKTSKFHIFRYFLKLYWLNIIQRHQYI